MRKIKLLILLSLASLQLTFLAAANGPKHPDAKRRGGSTTTPDKPGTWSAEQKRENITRQPERVGTESKSTTREERRPGASGRTRDKSSAWDRKLQKVETGRTKDSKSLESRLAEREKRSPGRGRVEKASRWERRLKMESNAVQEAKLREHVYKGWINSSGRPIGFHLEGRNRKPAEGMSVIEGSRSKEDAHGVYKAKIKAEHNRKTYIKTYHTFFPQSWSRAQVEKAIKEAYVTRERYGKPSNNYRGKTSSGILIEMKLNTEQIPRTAYPVYGKY